MFSLRNIWEFLPLSIRDNYITMNFNTATSICNAFPGLCLEDQITKTLRKFSGSQSAQPLTSKNQLMEESKDVSAGFTSLVLTNFRGLCYSPFLKPKSQQCHFRNHVASISCCSTECQAKHGILSPSCMLICGTYSSTCIYILLNCYVGSSWDKLCLMALGSQTAELWTFNSLKLSISTTQLPHPLQSININEGQNIIIRILISNIAQDICMRLMQANKSHTLLLLLFPFQQKIITVFLKCAYVHEIYCIFFLLLNMLMA